MTPPPNPADDARAALIRARAELATVASWGTSLGNGIRLAAVDAFDAAEAGAAPDGPYPPAVVPETDPGLTRAGAASALAGAYRDLTAAADTAPGREALAAGHAARALAAAGYGQ